MYLNISSLRKRRLTLWPLLATYDAIAIADTIPQITLPIAIPKNTLLISLPRFGETTSHGVYGLSIAPCLVHS